MLIHIGRAPLSEEPRKGLRVGEEAMEEKTVLRFNSVALAIKEGALQLSGSGFTD